jgi:glycosyltransferase involved in cell wall biosynthesis
MKIALATRRYPPLIGGAERVLSYLAPALAEEGAEVTVLTSAIAGVPALETPCPNLRVVRLATSRLRFVGTFLYMRELARWFASHPVDVAYVSMLKHDAYVAVGAGRRLGFPVVLRPEGAGATGDVAWQGWGRFGGRIAERCRQADAYVAISAAVRAELIAASYEAGKIIDLPNGVPIPAEPWAPLPLDLPPRASFVGRLAPEKGLHALVEAWPLVLRDHPTAQLTLVGEGPERPALEAKIRSLGLEPFVTLPGASPDPTIPLRQSSLFVLPSREEGMSIALLEAMALGIPCLASRIPGNQAILTEGVHGRLAPPDDPRALAHAILETLRDPDAPRQALEARRLVVERYSIAAVARRHLELFERLVAARGVR